MRFDYQHIVGEFQTRDFTPAWSLHYEGVERLVEEVTPTIAAFDEEKDKKTLTIII